MCIIGIIDCPNCGKKIDVLNWVLFRKDKLDGSDWPIGEINTCPHCLKLFKTVSKESHPSVWDEKEHKYKCCVTIPKFELVNFSKGE
jgi:hypothetical protein